MLSRLLKANLYIGRQAGETYVELSHQLEDSGV